MTNPDAEVVRGHLAKLRGISAGLDKLRYRVEGLPESTVEACDEVEAYVSRLEAQAALVPQLEESAEHVARELRRQAAAPTWGKRDAVAKWLVVLANRLSSIPSQEERA